MSSRTKICWNVDTSELDAAEERVVEKHGRKNPYLRIYIERVMREWLDRDRLTELETLVDDLAEQRGDSRSGFSRATYSFDEDADTDEIHYDFPTDLVNEYRHTVDTETDHKNEYGLMLSKLLHQHRTASRADRLEYRLRQLLGDDDAAEQTDEYDPDDQGIHYSEVELSKLDGRRRKYTRYLVAKDLDPDPEQQVELLMDEVREAVRENSRSETLAEDDEFIHNIMDTLGYVPNPINPESPVYVTPERSEEIKQRYGQDADANAGQGQDLERMARIDRTPFGELDKDERLIAIRLAFARDLYENDRAAWRFPYTFIETEAFETHTPSKGYANSAVEEVATEEGAITATRKHGRKCAHVKRDELQRECPTIWAYVTRDDESAAEPGESEPECDDSDALANVEGPTMDELMNAEPMRTDGGRPEPNRPA